MTIPIPNLLREMYEWRRAANWFWLGKLIHAQNRWRCRISSRVCWGQHPAEYYGTG